MSDFDAKEISRDYTLSILKQCNSIEEHLTDQGLDDKFTRLISIEAAYNTFKQLVSELTDKETIQQIYSVIEFDAKNLIPAAIPNVACVGHA
jgi:hypothetical protein